MEFHICAPSSPYAWKRTGVVGDAVVSSARLWGSSPSEQHPAPFQPVRSTCLRTGGGAGLGGRDREEAGPPIPGPGVLDPRSRSPNHDKQATAGLTPSVPPAAPGPRVPGPGPQVGLTQGAAKRPLPLPRSDQASPCLASLWPRRSGPRPRTSPGGCGSSSSAQRRLKLKTWPQRVSKPRRAGVHTLPNGLQEAPRQGRGAGRCFLWRRRPFLTSIEGA